MRKIKIQENQIGVYDNPNEYLIENGTINLCFDLPSGQGEFYASVESKLYKIENGRVTLPVKVGTLELKVLRMIKGEIVNVYRVEPLHIVQGDYSLTGTSAFKQLEDKIASDKEDIIQLFTGGLSALNGMLEENKIRLLAYLYADYENNVQVNSHNLPLDEFAFLLFGITELSDHDREVIEHIKELL